jgi:hypothetical protein
MKQYLDCECGSKKTYVSFGGWVCCSLCFKSLKERIIEKVDMTARVIPDSEGWSVKVNNVVKKYFSKYEDYASTEAEAYARRLNSGYED